ncbi:MAG: putative lyase, partial [uncultured Solirubrobacteraceae bacterium]
GHHDSSGHAPARGRDGLPQLLPRHARLRGPQRRRVRRHALDHRRPARPAADVDRPVPAGRHPGDHRRRAPHDRRDDGEGHLREHQPGDPGPRRHVRAGAVRRRRGGAGADGPAVRHPRLRRPRPRGQPDPHPAARL